MSSSTTCECTPKESNNSETIPLTQPCDIILNLLAARKVDLEKPPPLPTT